VADRTVDGVKTGHTEEAGFCLVASALRDGMRLISVVLGRAPTRPACGKPEAPVLRIPLLPDAEALRSRRHAEVGRSLVR